MHNRLRAIFGLLILAVLTTYSGEPSRAQSSGPAITGYTLVSQVPITRTVYEYTYRGNLNNPGPALKSATASVVSSSPNTIIVDGDLTFGPVAANVTAVSVDTFVLRQNRAVPFNPAVLSWTVNPVLANRPPIASLAPIGELVFVGSTAKFDGSGSSDPDGDVITYSWALSQRPAGSIAAIAPAAMHASFVPDRPGSYEVTLTVSDGQVSVGAHQTFTTSNSSPVSNAGPDQTASVGTTVTLNGTRSTDVDGDALTYTWTIAAAPSASSSELSDSTAPTPTLRIDAPGSFTIRLIVTDSHGAAGAYDEVVISTVNSPPVAQAGADQTIPVGNLAMLDASQSTDVDGDTLTYSWSVIAQPPGSAATLSDTSAVKPTFTVDVPGHYQFRVTVSDGFAISSDEVVISTSNTVPRADAGPDRSAHVGDTVSFDGSHSSDVDGDGLTYLWAITSAPAGSFAQLSSPTAIVPSLVLDRPGSYVLQLVVNDGHVSSSPDTVTATTVNSPPVADAGADQNFVAGQVVGLSGVGSSDPDGDVLTYSWSLVARPAESTAAVQNPTSAVPTFVADRAGTFVAQLIVSDGVAQSAPDTITITSTNTTPVANAGPDQPNSVLGSPVVLDGASSFDADGHGLTYLWSLIGRPASSLAVLSNSTTASPTFMPDAPGDYVAQLIVNDGFVDSAPDTVLLTVTATPVNHSPHADAGDSQSADAPGATVRLDGRRSSDPDGDPLTYLWTFISRPAGSAAVLSDSTSARPTFTVDLPGLYELQLIVSDGSLQSGPSDVSVNGNAPPVAIAGPTQVVNRGDVVHLDGSASFDPDPNFLGSCFRPIGTLQFPPVVYPNNLRWTWILNTWPGQQPADQPTLVGSDGPFPSFTAKDDGEYIAQLVVNDCIVNGESSVVHVRTYNTPPIANAGPDQSNVLDGSTAALDGTASHDPDAGDTLRYSWAFTERPPTSSAVLINPDIATPTFVLDRPGRYTVRLTVSDGLASSSDDVSIRTPNRQPTANAGANRIGTVGTQIDVPGSGSDPDGDALSYSWAIVSQPTGSAISLTNATSQTTRFSPLVGGLYTLRLVVSDGVAVSTPDDVDINVTSGSIVLSLLQPGFVGVGRSNTILVDLTAAAPAGGSVVSVASDAPGIAAVVAPGTVFIPAGQTHGQIAVSAVAPGATVVRASAANYNDGSVSVTVSAELITLPAAFSVAIGITTPVPIAIGPDPAPAGGVAITITSSDPTRVEVLTPIVSIPGGAFSANASVRGIAGGVVSLTAANVAPGYGTAVTNVASTGALNILETSVTMSPGLAGTIHIQLESSGSPLIVPAPGLLATLTSANPACVSVPATTTIPAGQTQVQQALAYGGTAALPCTTSVSIGAVGLASDSTNVTVNPNPGMTLFGPGQATFGTRYVGAGLQDGSYILRLEASNHGGVTVRLTSSDASKLLLAPNATTAGAAFIDVPVANGFTDANFYLQGVEGQVGSVTMTAAAPGFSGVTSGVINVVTPAVRLIAGGLGFPALPTSTTALSPDSPFSVAVGVPNDTSTDFRSQSSGQLQAVRAGGVARVVTVTSGTPSVGLPKTLSGSPASVTVTLAVGAAATPSTVAAGGVAFDPVAAGTTSMTVGIPGFVALPAASQTVTVTGPGMTLFGPGQATFGTRYVGAGLQDGSYILRLEASNHGGVTVRLTSSDASKLLLAPNATTAGAAFIDVPVANGFTDANFYLQGVEGQVGSVTMTAAAPGFSGVTSGVINVVTPAVRLIAGGLGFPALPTSTTALSPDSPFSVAVGVPNDTSTDFRSQSSGQLQAVRAGGVARVVTVTSGTPSVGLPKTLSGSPASVTVTLAVGAAATPSTVAAGGVAFDPVAAGTTSMTVGIPGFVALPAASQTVTVTGPGMTLFGPGQATFGTRYVGAGLQDGSYILRLEASNHGGVTVRLTSSDASKLLLAPNATTAGAAFIDVPVANGFTDANFYLQGVEGQVGSVTMTAAAPGFSGVTSGVINVVTPAVRLIAGGLGFPALPTSTTALSPDSPFSVAVGVPNDTSTDFRSQSSGQLQAVRAGGVARVVTVTSGTPSVGLPKTLSGSPASVTVTLAVGAAATPSTVAAGGVAFDPVAAGTTSMTVGIPGFVALPAASQTVTVTGPGMTLFGPGQATFGTRYVGAGLQDGSYILRLEASNHGGVTVRLTSSDASKLLLAPNATTAGAAFIDVPVANGFTDANFYLQGVEGQVGSVTMTAAAPGFSGVTSGVINVVTPAVRLIAGGLGFPALPTSTTALSPDSPFSVAVGVPNDTSTDFRSQSSGQLQAVRAGGVARVVTVTSGTPSVGLPKTLSGSPASVTVTLAVGAAATPSTVAAGGVAFDPVAAGTTSMTVGIPGFVALPAASQAVTVTTPVMTFFGPGQATFGTRYVGAGLQDGSYILRLEASNHGGVTVRLTSSDASKLLLAPNATTEGTAFIDVPVANGTTDANFYLQGVEGQVGSATVSASAPAFAPGLSGTVNVVKPGYRLSGLPTAILATGATTTFFVELGVPTTDESDLLSQSGSGASQAVRPGGLFIATVTNSNAIGAQLVTASGGAQSWSVNILAGQSRTASAVATGGIAFDPLSAACSATGCDTFVNADIPSLVKTTVGSLTVRVTP